MSNVQQESRVIIGVDRAHFAPLINDPINLNPADPDADKPEYVTPRHLPNLRVANVSRNDQTSTFYADNAARLTALAKGEKTVNVERFAFNNDEQRFVFGYAVDNEGVTMEGGSSIPPTGAFGFRRKYKTETGDAYEYVWHLKGSFGMPSQNAQTTEGTISPQYQQAVGTFVERSCDGWTTWQISSDDTTTIANLDTTWFTVETLQKLRVAATDAGGGGGSGSGNMSVSAETLEIILSSAPDSIKEAARVAQATADAAANAAKKAAEAAESAQKIADAKIIETVSAYQASQASATAAELEAAAKATVKTETK